MVLLSFILSFCAGPFDQKSGYSLSHSTKIYGPLSFILSLCTSIWLKIWYRLGSSFLAISFYFYTYHLTKVRGHSYSVIYSFLNWAHISFAIDGSAALTFWTLSSATSTKLRYIFDFVYMMEVLLIIFRTLCSYST